MQRRTIPVKPSPRSLLRVTLLLGLALLLSGCANYWSARRRDTADLFTLTATTGGGLKFQAGPVQVSPIALIVDVAGLRGGEWFSSQLGPDQTVFPMNMGALWWTSSVLVIPDIPRLEDRGKAYCAFPVGADREELFARHAECVPFLSVPRATWSEEKVKLSRVSTAYWGQLELAFALGGGLRVGTNLLEWADFVGGWIGADLLADDLGRHAALPAGLPVLSVPDSDKPRP